MNHLFNHQPLVAILAEVLDYSDLVNLSQIEKRLLPALTNRQQKLTVVQSWANRSDTFKELTNLQKLYFWRNGIIEIPPEIGQLTNLQRLYLNDNQITEIPPEIGQLSNLRDLSLTHNQITEIPPEIGQLTQQHSCNLKKLNLSRNRITEIPPEFKRTRLDIYI